MQEGSVSLFFGSYGLLFLFLWFWFSGLPVFSGFRFACFPGFPACSFFLVSGLPVFPGLPVCPFFLVSGLPVFPGLPVCPFSRVSGLLVFPGFRFARFPGFPACSFSRASGLPAFSGSRFARFPGFPVCSFSRVSGLPVFSGFPVFSRAFWAFFGLLGLFSVLYRGFFRFLFCICKVAVLFCPFGRKYTNPVPELQVVDYQIQPFR